MKKQGHYFKRRVAISLIIHFQRINFDNFQFLGGEASFLMSKRKHCFSSKPSIDPVGCLANSVELVFTNVYERKNTVPRASNSVKKLGLRGNLNNYMPLPKDGLQNLHTVKVRIEKQLSSTTDICTVACIFK